MAQTIDFTADGGNRAAAGIRSLVLKHGGIQYHSIILDEAKIAAYFTANSVTAANDDIYQIADVKKGDLLLGGFNYVEVAGGVAASAPTWGITTTDPDLFGTLDPDATAGTLVNETAGPYTMLVDDTLDLTVATQILISTGSGRWRLGFAVMKAEDLLSKNYLLYTGDPNNPPQV
jgi:hypothetical protein